MNSSVIFMRLFIIFFFQLITGSIPAQNPEEFLITKYSGINGLPEEEINNITRDSRGYIWIGSREGLFRFDGLHFRTWYANPLNDNSFRFNNIQVAGEYEPGQLLFLSGSDLWTIGTVNFSIKRLNGFREKSVFSIPRKINKGKWCIADADSVYITDNNFIIRESHPVNRLFPDKTIINLTPLHSPYILLSSIYSTLLYIFDTDTGKFLQLKIDDNSFDNRVKFIIPQAYDIIKKRLYFSVYFNGMYYIDLILPDVKQYTPVRLISQPSGKVLTSMLYKRDWVLQGGDQQFYLINTKVDTTYNLGKVKELQMGNSVITHFCPSNDSSIWVSTKTGIARLSINNSVVRVISTRQANNKDADITCLIKGTDKSLFYLDVNKGLNRLSPGQNSFEQVANTTDFGWSLIADGESLIITGGGKNVQFFNTRTHTLSEFKGLRKFFSKTTDLVTLVFRSRNGDLWYSCNGGAGILRQKEGTSDFIQYSRNNHPASFSHGYVHTAAEDSKGNIWWGSVKSSSLLKWNNKLQQFEEKLIENLLPDKINKSGIYNLYVDSRDFLWIATDGSSLIKYNTQNGSTELFSLHNGLPTGSVFGITEDNKGRIWFSTRKGLCCYFPNKNKFITFTLNDGLPEDNFNNKGIMYDKEEDRIWVAGKKSVASFNPDSFVAQAKHAIPPVFMDGFIVNGKPSMWEDGKPILLQPGENNIEITFSAVDFNHNDQLEFQYNLNKSGWMNAGDNRKISFNNMMPGKYEILFRCKYKINDDWGEAAPPFLFIIKTPWYKTTLFGLALLITIALAIWLIIRSFYLYKLQKQKAVSEQKQAVEKERTRIATDMHDDFGASLSRIKFISEKIKLVTPDDEGLGRDLTKISEYSDEMAEKMNEIVWALNKRYDSCEDLVSFCRSYASEYMLDKQLALNFHSNNIPDIKLQPEVRRNLFLAMKEALRNIVKHANATEVRISFHFENGIKISISDNGVGFDPGHIRHFANGLENMKKRMKDIGGTFELRSGEGTCIMLKADT